jgi:aspartate/methionine/tyrosine aminotransferase
MLTREAEKGSRVLVLADDAYFGLVYEDDVARESVFARLADAHENLLAVKIDGATKEDYVWGFRVGFLTYACKGITPAVCAALEAKTGGAVRGSISNASHLSQTPRRFSAPDYDDVKRKNSIRQRRYLEGQGGAESRRTAFSRSVYAAAVQFRLFHVRGTEKGARS